MKTNQKPSDAEERLFHVGKPFLESIFSPVLNKGLGEIEIRVFPNNRSPEQNFFENCDDALQRAHELCTAGIDVYFGVNPRTGKAGKKENVHYLTAFHAEIDYGSDGHKKESVHESYAEALKAISEFQPKPTLVNHSGGGFHCYWVLEDPVKVDEVGVEALENINRSLTEKLGGDRGTQDISRVLRVPGTYNFKLKDNPREVTSVWNDGPKYNYDQFTLFGEPSGDANGKSLQEKARTQEINIGPVRWSKSIEDLPVSQRIKSLILNGNDGTYTSRSEADQAVIMALVNKGLNEDEIQSIFQSFLIGEKYRNHNSPSNYLKHNIKKAKEFSDLSEEEMESPLFITGALSTHDGKYSLNIVKFQEYMARKYKLKYLESDNAFFKYNGACYEYCTEESLNYMCQQELGRHREQFRKASLKDFVHFAIGDELIDNQKAQQDRVNYLTFQNGLYDLNQRILLAHNPDIFTTNLLPYEYEPAAQCPRFRQYLEEVFMNNHETINLIQEAVGYAFHKTIPKPAIFFLIGQGSNGKSVFINTLTSLVGENNACSVSLNSLTKEYYILDLLGKMINISSETPHRKQINMDIVKAAVAGDWITGRVPYKPPTKFKSYAKHYLAMNEFPVIDDSSHGMWRRLYFIDFPRTFSEQEMDVNLTEKLQQELSGIFNWALEGYRRLRKNKFVFTQGPNMKKLKQSYKTQSNSVLAFAENHLRKTDPNDRVKYGEAYSLYLSFCGVEGYEDPEKKVSFKRLLLNAGYQVENSKKDGNQLYIFGVRLVED